LNYILTVLWLVVYTVGLPVRILTVWGSDSRSKSSLISYTLYLISAYTSSIVAVVWVSVIKRKMFLEIIDHISEVDNKIQYTLQEQTYMNRKVFLNVLPQIILLTVIQSVLTAYYVYSVADVPYYITVIEIIEYITDVCNTLFLFQFVNLVFIVKQRYTHLNKRLNNWIIVTMSRQISWMEENETCIRFHRTVGHVNANVVSVSNVGNIERTLKQTNIYLLRQIYSELYDIICLINGTYGVPILANLCWLLTSVLCTLYKAVINLDKDITYTIMCTALFFIVTYFCHTATNEAFSSGILVQKLLLEGNCRNGCVKELKMFSLQLQVMKIEYTACGFFSLNLNLFASFVSVIVSYIVIMVQIK
jgi:hypothetical protein